MSHHWNRALVTGASSGIGRAIARRLAAEHTDLVVVARDEARLKELAAELEVEVEVLVADLATGAGVGAVAERLGSEEIPVDLLVNNAGFGLPGPVVGIDAARQVEMVRVNVEALMVLSRAAGAAMAPRGRGGILNVSSTAGDVPSPGAAVYAATKAFVTSFSESLAMELAGSGVTVTSLRPGLTRTEFHQRAGYDAPSLPEALWQDADEVADLGVRAVDEGRVTVITGTHNRAASTLARLVPRPAVRFVTARLAPRSGR